MFSNGREREAQTGFADLETVRAFWQPLAAETVQSVAMPHPMHADRPLSLPLRDVFSLPAR